jgi:indolepyruvate ferredoxin oxidoreductase
VSRAISDLSGDRYDRAVRLAELPDVVRGYEEIKLRNVERFREEAAALSTEG